MNQLTKLVASDIQAIQPKYYYRSGNYHIVRSDNAFTIKSFSAKNSKCKHPEHFLGKNYAASFTGLDDAIQDCVCMASKSLKRNSGELIYESDQDVKRQPRPIQRVEWVAEEVNTQTGMMLEYFQDPEEDEIQC